MNYHDQNIRQTLRATYRNTGISRAVWYIILMLASILIRFSVFPFFRVRLTVHIFLLSQNQKTSIFFKIILAWCVILWLVLNLPNPSLLGSVNFIIQLEWIHTFPKVIKPKVNVIAELEFELADFEAIVQHFSHYVKATSTSIIVI